MRRGRLDPVEAWGWVCTSYTRNSLPAHAWSQLPRAYRVAWVMFIEKLQEADYGPVDEAKMRADLLAEARRQAVDSSPVIQLLRQKLEQANSTINRERKANQSAVRDARSYVTRKWQGRCEQAEAKADALRVKLAEAQVIINRLRAREHVDIIGVRSPNRSGLDATPEEIFKRNGNAEEPFSLAFPTREQREAFEAAMQLIDDEEEQHVRLPRSYHRRNNA